mmetsp:Transcript_64412/g.77369  ORF Transcript_64412/g.77369 Transcript_64412/m.77369 type:complete len:196 (-) Transcript_64412:189-776(-)
MITCIDQSKDEKERKFQVLQVGFRATCRHFLKCKRGIKCMLCRKYPIEKRRKMLEKYHTLRFNAHYIECRERASRKYRKNDICFCANVRFLLQMSVSCLGFDKKALPLTTLASCHVPFDEDLLVHPIGELVTKQRKAAITIQKNVRAYNVKFIGRFVTSLNETELDNNEDALSKESNDVDDAIDGEWRQIRLNKR